MNPLDQGRLQDSGDTLAAVDALAVVASPEAVVPVRAASADRSMRIVELAVSVVAIAAAWLVAAMR